jgi:hypothetical protein
MSEAEEAAVDPKTLARERIRVVPVLINPPGQDAAGIAATLEKAIDGLPRRYLYIHPPVPFTTARGTTSNPTQEASGFLLICRVI